MTMQRHTAQHLLRSYFGDDITDRIADAINRADTSVLSVQCFVLGLASADDALPWVNLRKVKQVQWSAD